MEESIERLLKEAKKEMEEEVRSGICGKVLGEEELTGTPTKKRTPPGAGGPPGKQLRQDSQTAPPSSKPSFGPGAFGLSKARLFRAASHHSSFEFVAFSQGTSRNFFATRSFIVQPLFHMQTLVSQAKPGALLAANDSDLFVGRYASQRSASTAGSASGLSDLEFSQSCASIARLLEPSLSAKITNEHDQELFIRCLVADGMDSWFQVLATK